MLINSTDSNTSFFSNNCFNLFAVNLFVDVFKINLELLTFFKIFDQVETTSGLILSKLLNDPKVKYLFLTNGGGFSFLSKSNPQ